MIRINLVDEKRNSVETIEVEAAEIAESACIEYKGKYYYYSGIFRGDISNSIYTFMESNPPLHIPEQIKL